MASAWEYLERLCRFEHRGTATAQEAMAAEELKRWLLAMGYDVAVQEFRAPRDTLYLGPAVVMAGFAVVAMWLGHRWPWAGLLLCAALLLPMAGELLASDWLDFDQVLPRYPSRNLVARQPGRSEGPTVVITAHYDTQRASYLFHPAVAPFLQGYFTLIYGLLAAVPVLTAVRWVWPEAAWAAVAAVAVGACLAANVAFLLLCRATGRHINGANDNGSGTALALALAERFARQPPAGVNLLVVLTGAEEVGTRGMKHFMRTCRLDPQTTRFVNLDNIGGGTLHYLEGEGMLAFRPYAESLIALAGETAAELGHAIKPKHNLLLPTDGLIPSRAGFAAISFLAFADDGSLPNYHWYTDTLDRVDRELLLAAEWFLCQYVSRLAGTRAEVQVH